MPTFKIVVIFLDLGRLAFCLKDAIPQSAIEAGHIFLGFSKCGQVDMLTIYSEYPTFEYSGDLNNQHLNTVQYFKSGFQMGEKRLSCK